MTPPVAVSLALGLLALHAPGGETEVRSLKTGEVVRRTSDAPSVAVEAKWSQPRPPGVVRDHGSPVSYRVGATFGEASDALFTVGRHGISLELTASRPSGLELWMQRWDPATLKRRDRIHLHTGDLDRHPWISADGRYVLITEILGRNRRELRVFSLETGRAVMHIPEPYAAWSAGPLLLTQSRAPSKLTVYEIPTGRVRFEAPIQLPPTYREGSAGRPPAQ